MQLQMPRKANVADAVVVEEKNVLVPLFNLTDETELNCTHACTRPFLPAKSYISFLLSSSRIKYIVANVKISRITLLECFGKLQKTPDCASLER